MRLHRLEVTAFGPFPGTEVIDFDALSDAGLFLIQGQTGAGKTSVLDAVCYALYGQVPGARNAVKGLRSDHAAPDQGPRVTLEATIRGRRFRIGRSPGWERPKKRGSGTTFEQARVSLEELGHGTWTTHSTRLDEAGDLIGRLLGMNAAQFCQVAMLPQGEFAAFLRAGAEERRKVLERLFATEIFTQVEKWLAEHRAATRREAAALRADAESIADRIAESTGTDRPGHHHLLTTSGSGAVSRTADVGEEAFDGAEVLVPWAAELAGQHDAIRVQAEGLRDEATARLEAAKVAAEHGRALADRQSRHAEALRRQAVLAEHVAQRTALNARLEAAARADRVLPLIRAAADRARRAEQARRRAAEARAAVGALVPPNAAEDVLVKAERSRRDEAAALEGLRGEAVRLRRLTADIGTLLRKRDGLDTQEAALSAKLADLPGHVEALRSQLDGARVLAAGRAGAEAHVREAAQRLGAAERLQQVTRLLADAEAAHQSAVDTAQELRDRLQDIRQARLDGMAAALAESLRDGEPCQVCGSTEHPAPASSVNALPSDPDEERAEAAYDRAQDQRERTGRHVEGHRTERDQLLDIVGDASVETLAAAVAEAEQAVAASADADAAAERLEAALHRAEQELSQAQDQRTEVARALADAEASHKEQVTEATRLRIRLDEARGEDPTLESRIDRLLQEAEALATAVEALRQADTATGEHTAATTNAIASAHTEGFLSTDTPATQGANDALYAAAAEAVTAAALSDVARGELRTRVRAFDDEEAAVRALLDDPDLKAAADVAAPDLAGLEAELRSAEETFTSVASACDRARQRCIRLDELRADLAVRVAAWRPAAERHTVAAHLAGLASGQSVTNRLSMRLSAYVLAARLEQVVAAANERLARMSAGRYALQHTIDKAAGDRRGGSGGLGLRVVDAWTGQERDPVTLSGGESFITSLALALGLADVVTAEAGGTEINTLFVDEGFGTLDEETLDEVMEVLDGLRDGGRAVGIVSHVAELRTRIPAQLRVRKHRTGSTTAVTA